MPDDASDTVTVELELTPVVSEFLEKYRRDEISEDDPSDSVLISAMLLHTRSIHDWASDDEVADMLTPTLPTALSYIPSDKPDDALEALAAITPILEESD